MSQNDLLIAGPARGPLNGTVRVPGDKSMSHRVVMLASLAEGVTEIRGFLPGEDNLATVQMFVEMGVPIEWLNEEKTALRIHGVGLHGLKPPTRPLDAGNSGTCVRLMAGVLAGQPFKATVVGDASLSRRPMKRIVEPLRRMGAVIEGRDGGNLLPLTISGGELKPIQYVSPVASAQVKSCILLAGLYAQGETRVTEPRPSRDHTERMLPLFGQTVHVLDEGTVSLLPAGRLKAPDQPVHIPRDPSSAAFFAVAATLVEGSVVDLPGIGINPRRDGWRRILLDMGADITETNRRRVGEEEVADIHVRHAQLHGMHVQPADVPDAIDEFPVLFSAAALADGRFVLDQAQELRVKESDRIAVMCAALNKMGALMEERPDGVVIHGVPKLHGDVEIDACGDHRIAMACSIAAQQATGEIRIRQAAAIATSFPDFVSHARNLGMNVRWEGDE